MGSCGVAALFLPRELLRAIGVQPAEVLPVIIQLTGALLFASAMVNWTARGSLIGGIYNRPVAIGNLTHFAVGALSLAKAVLAGVHTVPAIALTCVYVVFAVAFTMIFFRSPVSGRDARD